MQDRLAETERLKKECATKIVATAVAPTRSVFDGICGVTILTSGDSDPKDKLGIIRNTSSVQRPNNFRPRTADPVFKPNHPTPTIITTISGNNTNSNNSSSKEFNLRSNSVDHSFNAINSCRENDLVSEKFLTDSTTISIPIPNQSSIPIIGPPKYKTMPSPTRANTILPGGNCLNEIYEEGTDVGSSDTSATTTPRPVARHTAFINNNRANSHSHTSSNSSSSSSNSNSAQRRSKFHKTRTASCSSSDDDDSENRKKRAHKIVDSTKPFQPQRRDSHDDSSDSQDPSNATASGNGGSQCTTQIIVRSHSNDQSQDSVNQSNNDSNTNGRQKSNQQVGFRRHRAGRRRAGETRLRESQSLNRITEVQESELPLASLIQNQNATPKIQLSPSPSSSSNTNTPAAPLSSTASSPTIVAASTSNTKTVKMGFSARLFQGFRKMDTSSVSSSNNSPKEPSPNAEPKNQHNHFWNGNSNSTNDEVEVALSAELAKALKVTSENKSSSTTKKLKMLGRYFQVRLILFLLFFLCRDLFVKLMKFFLTEIIMTHEFEHLNSYR